MKDFHHFNDAIKIPDENINRWLEELRYRFLEEHKFFRISVGDMMVCIFVWETTIDIDICTSSGRSTINFTDQVEFLNYNFNYKRPTP